MGLTRQEKLRKDIKDDLLIQLVRNGTGGRCYTDLVDKYMDFWDTEIALIEDIKQRGVAPMIMGEVSEDIRKMIRLIKESR